MLIISMTYEDFILLSTTWREVLETSKTDFFILTGQPFQSSQIIADLRCADLPHTLAPSSV
mgnify:FL=1